MTTTGERRLRLGWDARSLGWRTPKSSTEPQSILNSLAPVPVKAYVALSDADGVFHWLERGFDERAAQMRMIEVTPAFGPLRADPRWAQLFRRSGLER